jgi:hypothetical protein
MKTWTIGALHDLVSRWQKTTSRVRLWRHPELATVFLDACRDGDVALIEQLAPKLPTLHFRGLQQWTPPADPFHTPAENAWLKAMGVNAGDPLPTRLTPLQAALYGKAPLTVLPVLLRLGADPNRVGAPPEPPVPSNRHWMPAAFHLPLLQGETMPLLMELSMPTHPYRCRSPKMAFETTCFWEASMADVFVILAQNATPETLGFQDHRGYGLLHYAVMFPEEGGRRLCEALVNAGADPLLQDRDGHTATDGPWHPECASSARLFLKACEARAHLERALPQSNALPESGTRRHL